MIEIYNKKGKKVGFMEDVIYYTTRKPEHFMIKYQGFGISQSIIDSLVKFGCIHICFDYLTAQGRFKRYTCPLRLFINTKKTHLFEEDDLQVFVSIKDMNNPNSYSEVER